jgi:hypothetical protein
VHQEASNLKVCAFVFDATRSCGADASEKKTMTPCIAHDMEVCDCRGRRGHTPAMSISSSNNCNIDLGDFPFTAEAFEEVESFGPRTYPR